MKKVKSEENCPTCNHTTYNYKYLCDQCGKEISIDPIQVDYVLQSESDKHALIDEDDIHFCSWKCLVKNFEDEDEDSNIIRMTINNVNHEHFKREVENHG